MPLSFVVSDAEADTRLTISFGRGEDGIARVNVTADVKAATGARITLSDLDTLDAIVADGTITAAERTALVGAGGVLRRIALRARGRMGVAP
jgi:hypothetical protein